MRWSSGRRSSRHQERWRRPRFPPTYSSSRPRFGRAVSGVELAYIRYVLEEVKGNQTRAAEVLGISRKALWEKRRRYGIG